MGLSGLLKTIRGKHKHLLANNNRGTSIRKTIMDNGLLLVKSCTARKYIRVHRPTNVKDYPN